MENKIEYVGCVFDGLKALGTVYESMPRLTWEDAHIAASKKVKELGGERWCIHVDERETPAKRCNWCDHNGTSFTFKPYPGVELHLCDLCAKDYSEPSGKDKLIHDCERRYGRSCRKSRCHKCKVAYCYDRWRVDTVGDPHATRNSHQPLCPDCGERMTATDRTYKGEWRDYHA